MNIKGKIGGEDVGLRTKQLKLEHKNMETWIKHVLFEFSSWYTHKQRLKRMIENRVLLKQIKSGELE